MTLQQRSKSRGPCPTSFSTRTLINRRMTWLNASHSLIAVALATLIKREDSRSFYESAAYPYAITLCLYGIMSSVLFLSAYGQAVRALNFLVKATEAGVDLPVIGILCDKDRAATIVHNARPFVWAAVLGGHHRI
ncbi:hypothetical protein JKP88DRAFT_242895 [Tribonema minus]|uniref:Uncharacterized protein n=1 Tax=Tribonema minus TaxID=303371 RepID=A0A835ZF28_9STRA|nr:hypothetical protein JKP88DRAFT_242895 [Tribonema minus]